MTGLEFPPPFDVGALVPLILFALWAVVLQLVLAFARVSAMRRDKRAINTFKPHGDSESLDAISRAHMNTVENLPVFAVLYGALLYMNSGCLTHCDTSAYVTLAWVVLGARIVQSIAHIASRSERAVQVRAGGQFIQIACFAFFGLAALALAMRL